MQAKKSLGQNFFINENLGNQIVSRVLGEELKRIVEIGPGEGFFTDKFLKHNVDIIAIEKDNQLAEKLKTAAVNILNLDFLEWDFHEIENEDVSFFGSLPYNVSKPIIYKIISSKYFRNPCYFIIQKEVADKYCSKEPNSNLLAMKTGVYAKCQKILDIKPSSFRPAPKVMSSLISFTPIQTDIVNKLKFESFLENCFNHPRKTLRNNLRNLSFGEDKKQLLEKRPQHLSLDDFYALFIDIQPVLV